MQFLSWHRLSANHHELRALDGTLWAEVRPHVDPEVTARRPMLRGTVRHPDFALARGDWWVLGSSVASAKSRVAAWMTHNACAAEDFDIVPADRQIAEQGRYKAWLDVISPAALTAAVAADAVQLSLFA